MIDNWKLIEVVDRAWKQDTSGLYIVIYFTVDHKIRVDVMDSLNMPLVSFMGQTASAVYKGLADWLELQKIEFSNEHSFYIGVELAKAESLTVDYVQS